MVEFEDITEAEVPPSQERLLDAEEIEKAAANATRPTVKMHLESLAKKLRKESEALKRVEASRNKQDEEGEEEEKPIVEEVVEEKKTEPAPAPPKIDPPRAVSGSVTYVPIDKFAFDAGGYNSAFVTLYIDLPGVGSSVEKENVTCDFTSASFDLIVRGYKGKNYRLCRDNLENEIDTSKSKKVIKADKILVKLAKKKSEYGSYDHWSSLTAKKKKPSTSNKDNPTAGIMDLMKDMYESGDDNMRKIIGETMMKQREGKLGDGMGGLGDMDMDV